MADYTMDSPFETHEKIRVLRIIARMNLGGPAIQISGLMKEMDPKKFEQILVTGYCDESEIDLLEASDYQFRVIRIQELGRNIKAMDDLVAFFKIRRVIKAFKPAIVHTHTAKAGLLGRLASMSIRGTQHRIHTYHGHLLHGYFSPIATKILTIVERILAFKTEVLITVGEQVKKDLLAEKIGTEEKYSIIGPGLELAPLPERKQILNSYGFSKDCFTVAWAGRVVPIKAPHRILEIAQICRHLNLSLKFIVAGDGPLLESLMIDSRERELPIYFLGWQRTIENVLAISDVMILTSENEGTPVALIQAQMAGIPVISTGVGSASEVFDNFKSGFLLPYSPISFAEKIHELSNNKSLYNKMSQHAIKSSRRFTISRLVSDHEALYLQKISQAI